MDAARFDGYEVMKVMAVNEGGDIVPWEATSLPTFAEPASDDAPLRWCRWSLYGHLPEGGVECIADFKSKADAVAAMRALERADGVRFKEGRR